MKQQKLKNIIIAITAVVIITAIILCAVFLPLPTAEKVFNDNVQSIVELKAYTESVSESYGTAEFIDKKGVLVTNAHVVTYIRSNVVNTFEEYSIRFSSETEYREAELIKYDTEKDIAILKITDTTAPFKTITIGNSNELNFGDKVYAIGNGSNYGLAITQGIISMPKVNIEYDSIMREVIQCDITISAGNSGGALLDERGKLIGITTFRTKDGSGNVVYGIAYSIPINTIMKYYNTN